jgi:hypothetical protein
MGSALLKRHSYTNVSAAHKGFPIPMSDSTGDAALAAIIQSYTNYGQVVEVNFRELSPIKPGEDRLTHLMHSYPAKLLPNIPSFFINCSSLISRNQLVYE